MRLETLPDIKMVENDTQPRKSVFVVDDDPAVCRALSRLLRSHGYRVRSFPSADAFLEQGVDSAPDCMVLDVQMPGTDGLTLQARLVELGSTIPVIIITALGSEATRDTAMSRGAAAYIEKPVRAEALLEAVQQAVDS